MATIVSIRYNTSRPATMLASYTVHVSDAEPDQDITGGLASVGGNYNGWICTQGIFATRREAVQAVLDYVDASFRLWEVEYYYGARIVAATLDRKARDWQYATGAKSLGMKTPHGVFVGKGA